MTRWWSGAFYQVTTPTTSATRAYAWPVKGQSLIEYILQSKKSCKAHNVSPPSHSILTYSTNCSQYMDLHATSCTIESMYIYRLCMDHWSEWHIAIASVCHAHKCSMCCELLWLYARLRFHVYIYEPAHVHSGNCSGWWPPCMEVFVPVGEGKSTRSGPAQAPLECLMWQSNATCVRACALFSHLLCMPSNKLHWLLSMTWLLIWLVRPVWWWF